MSTENIQNTALGAIGGGLVVLGFVGGFWLGFAWYVTGIISGIGVAAVGVSIRTAAASDNRLTEEESRKEKLIAEKKSLEAELAHQKNAIKDRDKKIEAGLRDIQVYASKEQERKEVTQALTRPEAQKTDVSFDLNEIAQFNQYSSSQPRRP